MPLPEPVPGLVIRYSYLWWREHARGQEEGVKDRPCAVVAVVSGGLDINIVTVLPVTHSPPATGDLAVEIPYPTKRRLSLDGERSWVVLSEANRFTWPGPDLRTTAVSDGSEGVAYGLLPRALFKDITGRLAAAFETGRATVVRRTE